MLNKKETKVDWARFKGLINSVKVIEERMDSLEKEFGLFSELYKISEENGKPIDDVLNAVKGQIVEPKEPYRDVVTEILNEYFKIEVADRGENFLFTLIIPKDNSNLSTSDYSMMGGDKRSIVLSRTMGENGVRDFCEKIKKILN